SDRGCCKPSSVTREPKWPASQETAPRCVTDADPAPFRQHYAEQSSGGTATGVPSPDAGPGTVSRSTTSPPGAKAAPPTPTTWSPSAGTTTTSPSTNTDSPPPKTPTPNNGPSPDETDPHPERSEPDHREKRLANPIGRAAAEASELSRGRGGDGVGPVKRCPRRGGTAELPRPPSRSGDPSGSHRRPRRHGPWPPSRRTPPRRSCAGRPRAGRRCGTSDRPRPARLRSTPCGRSTPG